jgi:hypothetical protein
MSAVVPQSKVQVLSSDGLLERRIVAVEQVPDCRPDEVGAIRIKPLRHQPIDVAKVDISKIDRDLFAVRYLRQGRFHQFHSSLPPSPDHPTGW